MDSVVMIILAILVLGALVFFFFGTFTPSADAIKAQQTIASVCGELAQYRCQESAYSSGSTEQGIDFTPVQEDKLRQLNTACQTTKAASCSGNDIASQKCIDVCCRTFCPSTTTTTTK